MFSMMRMTRKGDMTVKSVHQDITSQQSMYAPLGSSELPDKRQQPLQPSLLWCTRLDPALQT
jgi:hypothetical protein